jgi:lipoate-protein ligase A
MTKDEALKKAFKQAFQLGQDYWYQADHEYESQNKKSDVTRAKFEQLMEDAIKEALAHRTWVGLTEDEAFACKGRDYFETYKAIEAKLKEKNT